MPSVALIGPDGAGKTTLTRMLETSGLLPFKYLYMGVDISASNVALPTSRLMERIRRRELARRAAAVATNGSNGKASGDPAGNGTSHGAATGSRAATAHRRPIRAAARLGNRLGEEWYRQLVSWIYQVRGFVVLCDRHFLFDFAPEIVQLETAPLDQRLHCWFLANLYPRPDLVIFLDAPGEVLFSRKGESSVEELERRRQAFLRQGERLENFVRVDATRPLDEVYAEITGHVLRLARQRRPRPAEVTP